jgi:hypothetical protein
MKTTHATSKQSSQETPTNVSVGGGVLDSGKGRGRSAPSKFSREKSVIDEEEAIPAATYEPSDSSDDFQAQVDKVIGGEAESSRRSDFARLVICCRAYSPGTHARKEEEGLLLEFPGNPTRTRSV